MHTVEGGKERGPGGASVSSLAEGSGRPSHAPHPPLCCCIQATLRGFQDPRVTPVLKIMDPRDSEDLKLHPSPGQDISRDRVSPRPLYNTPQCASGPSEPTLCPTRASKYP